MNRERHKKSNRNNNPTIQVTRKNLQNSLAARQLNTILPPWWNRTHVTIPPCSDSDRALARAAITVMKEIEVLVFFVWLVDALQIFL